MITGSPLYSRRFLSHLALLCVVSTLVLGIFATIGRVASTPWLTALKSGSIQIAPSAVLLVLLFVTSAVGSSFLHQFSPISAFSSLLVWITTLVAFFILNAEADAGFPMHIPSAMADLPAAIVTQNERGVVQGLDYCADPVLKTVQNVPDSPWLPFAKIDQNEVNRPPYQRLVWITGLICSLFLCSWRIAALIRRNRRRAQLHRFRNMPYRTKARLEYLNRSLRATCDIKQLVAQAESIDELINLACDLLVTKGNCVSALIVLTDTQGSPVNHTKAGVRESCHLLAEEIKRGRLPACYKAANVMKGEFQVYESETVYSACDIACDHPRTKKMSIRLKYKEKRYGYLLADINHNIAMAEEDKRLFIELAEYLACSLYNLEIKDAVLAAEEKARRLEAQLIQAQKMETIGQLAGGVAHDFNNLLTVIISYSQMLSGKFQITSSVTEAAKEIYKAADRAKDLTRQLLTFSRKQSLRMLIIDVNQVVDSFSRLMRRIIGENIRIDLSLAPEPSWVKADILQLEQIIMNLAVNSRDAMPEGGVLTIATSQVHRKESYVANQPVMNPGTYIMLRISDNGLGMDQDTVKQIFEPFFTTKPIGYGTGLGLATVYNIVKQHCGYIWVCSEPGQGTTFKICFPAVNHENIKIEEKVEEQSAI